MKNIARLASFALVLSSASVAVADPPASPNPGAESPKPITGKAPADPPKSGEGAKVAAEPGNVFDASELGTPDKATEALIKTVEEKCSAEPRSREGMSPREEKRCNATVARLVQQGSRAVPAIFAKLNAENDFSHYYARTRLYYALGKMDDPKVEDILIRGFARVATKKLDGYSNDLPMIQNALVAMNGVDPVGAEAIGKPDITDQWASAEDQVFTWRLWQRDHAGKTKTALKSEALKRARADKSSKNLKTAYLALSTLAELAPPQALKAVNKLLEGDELTSEEKNPFYNVMGRAYENGATDAPDPEMAKRAN